MIVTLEDGEPLRGDFVLRVVQRFDLTAIPGSLEIAVRADSKATSQLAYGSVLRAGSARDRYRIVKSRRAQGVQPQQVNGPLDVVEFTAILDQFVPLAFPLKRAVVKVGKSLGEVYRACGATCAVKADIPVPRFSCFVGNFATKPIARVLQEEAAVPVWSQAASLSFLRYQEMFDADPVLTVGQEATRVVESPFLEQHEIPTAYSLDANGGVLLGRRDVARASVFLPWSTRRVVENMSRCLVVRRTLAGAFAGQVRAGDCVEVAGVRHVVVTAAHHTENGGDSAASQTTHLWLAQLQR